MSRILFIAALTLFVSSSSFAVQISPFNENSVQSSDRALYKLVLNNLADRLKAKGKTDDIFVQAFAINPAAPANCPSQYDTVKTVLMWRWKESPIYKIEHVGCKTNDIAKDDTLLGIIDGSFGMLAVVNENFKTLTFDPNNNPDFYKSSNDGEFNSNLVMSACLPEGYRVYGWENPSVLTQSKKDGQPTSYLMDNGTRDILKPNCVLVKVHLQGNGVVKLGDRVISNNGGASLGISMNVYGVAQVFQAPLK